MGKNKRQKLAPHGTKRNRSNGKGAHPKGVTKSQGQAKKPKSHIQTQHSVPTIPFRPSDRILLIGEGDLSFARSLVETHHCGSVTATVYEKEEELREKYPHVADHIQAVEEGGASVRYGVDATKMGPVWREMKGKVDRVVFNFPHVGGKSTDVNRQVRYNQELLVTFFKNALVALAPSSPGSTSSIIVTLFEGEPYTLWNIRDLGRHAGLQVERSFKFQARAYPGYKHARTLGVIKGKNGEGGAGWRGEERSARSYVFVRKGEGIPVGNGTEKKRKLDENSDEEDDSNGDSPAEEQGTSDNWDETDEAENTNEDSEDEWAGIQDSDSDDQNEEHD